MSAIPQAQGANGARVPIGLIEQRILHFHREGLDRFTRVIDGNSQYDILLSHRLSEEQIAEFSGGLDSQTARLRAIALAERAMRKRTPKLLYPSYHGFVCDGQTSNNIREFEFFEHLCAPLNINILANNYATAARRPPCRAAAETEAILEAILADVRAFYAARESITASLVHQQILYSKSFFNFLIAFTEEDAVLPAAVVQANDHSPVRVALSMVMKGLGVIRVYLQHAEVSDCFPPLDFDYSVLRNGRSLAVYERIGPVSGRTFVIARDAIEPQIDALCRPREGRVEVVIYPTSRVVPETLRKIVERLKANPAVSSVALKQHPGAARPLDDLLKDTGVILLTDSPTSDHVAIVGNSSVAIELIARGIPVYQNFDFDPVERDYYGFVRDSVTQEVTLDELSDRFWTPYVADESWRAALRRWLPDRQASKTDTAAFQAAMKQINPIGGQPAATGDSRRLNRRHFTKRLKRFVWRGFTHHPKFARRSIRGLYRVTTILSGWAYKADARLKADTGHSAIKHGRPAALAEEQARRQELATVTIRQSRNPANWLVKAEALGVFEPIILIRAIDAMLGARDPSISELFEDLPNPPWDSTAGLYAYLRKSKWINTEIAAPEIDRIANTIEDPRLDEAIKGRLTDALFSAVISYGSPEQLDRMLDRGSRVRWQMLSFNRRLQVLRKFASTGRDAEAETQLQELKRVATPLEALKLRNFEFLSGWLDEDWSHQDAEEEFLNVVPSAVAQDFHALVAPAYAALRPRMRYMEMRTNAEQRAALVGRIETALITKDAFSCIRLSDREGYLFAEQGRFGPSDVLNCENHWWGTELAPDLRAQIVAEARAAIGTADVVGIPAIHRFIRDVSVKTASLVATLQSRGLVDVLTGIRTVAAPEALFSEDKVNVGLFGNLETVEALASRAHRLVIVTSVRADYLPAKLRAHNDLYHIGLPTHYKTRLNEKHVRSNDILPNTYPRLIEELESVAEPGTLVLVAGGLIGKIFVGRARAKGAVVLDMGHVVDDWTHNRLSALR